MVSTNPGSLVIVKASAPGLKVIPSTSTPAEVERSVTAEVANVAVSAGPFGIVFGIQFAAVFQSPLIGFRFQVALSASAV
jgi:hypothetical protein